MIDPEELIVSFVQVGHTDSGNAVPGSDVASSTCFRIPFAELHAILHF